MDSARPKALGLAVSEPTSRVLEDRRAVNLGRAEEAASDPSFLPRLSFASLVDLLTLPSLPTYSKCLKM